MEQKKQMRYSDEELALIRSTFKEDKILKDLRKYFWGIADAQPVFKTKPVIALIRKTFLPELDGDAPISQIVDLWLTLAIKDKNTEDAYPFILARDMLVSYFKNKIEMLGGATSTNNVTLADMERVSLDIDNAYINLVARTEIIAHIEQQLAQLNILANHSVEEITEAMKKNSTK